MLVASLLTLVTIGLWATGLLAEYLTALLFFTAATITGAAPASAIFSGFASSAFWLVLSGFVLGAAIRRTGLADRVARQMATRLSGSYAKMIAGVVLLTYGLAFVMPSNMGRIALLMPIVTALADRAHMAADDPGRDGLGLAVGFGTFMLSASILPSNVPNQIMAGAIENAYGLHLTYVPYLLLHAPILGVGKGVLLTGCILLLFRGRPQRTDAPPPAAPWSAAERRLALLLLATLGLWLTDAVHGVAPAWVGLAAACVCLLPRVGFLTGDEFASAVNVRTLIYVAAILGLAALVTHSGIADWVGRALLAVAPLDPSTPFRDFVSLVGITFAMNFVVTANSVPALYTPLARTLADASGLPLMTVLMVQVIGFSTTVLPYQASPIVVAMQMGGVGARAAIRLALALAVLTFVLLVPASYAWFGLLGRL